MKIETYLNVIQAVKISRGFLYPILSLLMHLQSPAVLASNSCHEVYSSLEVFQSTMKNLTPEVQEAIGRSISNLAELRLSLDLAQAAGRSSMALTALTADYQRKELALVEYLLRYNIMTKAELVVKIKQEIVQLQDSQMTERKLDDAKVEEVDRHKEVQDRQLRDTVIDGKRAIFHRIEPGSFMMGELGKKVPVTITKPFDMMATLMTQIVWRTVADLVNSKFQSKHKINPNPSHFQDDARPVEMVSLNDIRAWIRGLNRLSKAGDPALAELIPGHTKGDVYRLPTEGEWEFVLRGRGHHNELYHFGNQISQMRYYAWIAENSDRETHAVAQKKPLVIDGKEFYDMYGNVREWTYDGNQSTLQGGAAPQAANKGMAHVVRGGSWNYDASSMSSDQRYFRTSNNRYNDLGFRLVREGR